MSPSSLFTVQIDDIRKSELELSPRRTNMNGLGHIVYISSILCFHFYTRMFIPELPLIILKNIVYCLHNQFIVCKQETFRTLSLGLFQKYSRPPWEGTFFSTPLPIINNFHLTLPPTITHFIVLQLPIFFFIRSTTH